jgi:hypothetical protein
MSVVPKFPASLAKRGEEDAYLSWFAGRGIPVEERRLSLGGFSYYQFTASFQAGDRSTTSHGRSEVRKLAALKCTSECVERQFVASQFRNSNEQGLPPKALRTTNGWAVHQDLSAAKEAAYREALERHLHLKSFLTYGWAGFRLCDRIEGNGLTLYFLTSRFIAEGLIAGLAVAKSPLYAGVTFGYTVGRVGEEASTNFWESAIYEAIDKILALNGAPIDISGNPTSWIVSEIKHYLEAPFELALLQAGKGFSPEQCSAAPGRIQSFDLAAHHDLRFPLYAAYVAGGDLIPLFSKPRLSTEDFEYLAPILKKNGIGDLPERHPVL